MERHANHVGPSTLAGGILRSVAATAVAAGLALACAQGMDASGDLRVLGFGLPDEIATVRVDTFEAAYPDVNLEITEGAIDQQQLLTAIASGRPPDVVYLDPMFPHRDKSALVKKEMRLFRPLVGDDQDAPALLEAAQALASHRVVVKRPRKAPIIEGARPGYALEGKSSRYDIYPKKKLGT